MMHRSFNKLYASLIILGSLALCAACTPVHNVAASSPGLLDLRHWDFLGSPLVTLSGPWLAWPGDVNQKGEIPESLQRPLAPGPWIASGLPEQGTVTYQLTILVPQRQNWGILLGKIESAYRLYANGEEILSAGIAGSDAASTHVAYTVQNALLPGMGIETIKLSLTISNFSHPNGGIHGPIILGEWHDVQRFDHDGKFWEIALFGAFVMFALYHFLLYLYRPKAREYLYFALLCLCFGVFCTFFQFFALQAIIPNLSGDFLFRSQQILACLAICAGIGYMQRLFPQVFSRIPALINAGILILCAIIMALIPEPLLIYSNSFLLIVALASMAHTLYQVIKCIRAKLRFSLILLLGFILIAISMGYDLACTYLWPSLGGYTPFGLLLACIFQALLLARRFWNAYSNIHDLAQNLEAQQMELLRQNAAYGRFVPIQFLKHLGLESISQTKLGDHVQRTMTVMFTNINHFQAITERLGQQGALSWINGYLNRLGPIIREFDGFVDKYFGETMMALFDSQPELALEAALAIQMGLRDYNQELSIQGLPLVNMGIGMHCGPLMLGIIGESGRMENTVIADAVNLSSRIGNLSNEFQSAIIITQSMFESLSRPERYAHRRLGPIKVKGRSNLVELIEILTPHSDPSAAAKIINQTTYHKALEAFQRGDKKTALVDFEALHLAFPEDPVYNHYLKQIRKSAKI